MNSAACLEYPRWKGTEAKVKAFTLPPRRSSVHLWGKDILKTRISSLPKTAASIGAKRLAVSCCHLIRQALPVREAGSVAITFPQFRDFVSILMRDLSFYRRELVGLRNFHLCGCSFGNSTNGALLAQPCAASESSRGYQAERRQANCVHLGMSVAISCDPGGSCVIPFCSETFLTELFQEKVLSKNIYHHLWHVRPAGWWTPLQYWLPLPICPIPTHILTFFCVFNPTS